MVELKRTNKALFSFFFQAKVKSNIMACKNQKKSQNRIDKTKLC